MFLYCQTDQDEKDDENPKEAAQAGGAPFLKDIKHPAKSLQYPAQETKAHEGNDNEDNYSYDSENFHTLIPSSIPITGIIFSSVTNIYFTTPFYKPVDELFVARWDK